MTNAANNLEMLKTELAAHGTPEKAKASAWFFKTGPGQYGEGDVFLGVTVPEQRKVVKKYRDLPLGQVEQLLQSQIHEHRLTALLILVDQFKRGGDEVQALIYDFYLANTTWINNWDLVDSSAPTIVGGFLLTRDRSVLRELASSDSLWERRIAILATFAFINEGEAADTLAIAEILLYDEHDLIHKAVGWALREVGKRVSQEAEEEFLLKHYRTMPRTTLRYAIERFPEDLRQGYLKGRI
jgi:3-methyladenine DNA glycosylase AlkD